MSAKRAFTLIEMGIALAVIATLATLFLVSFTGERDESKIDRARADLQVIQMGLEEYRARFGDYPRVPTAFTDLAPVDDAKSYLLNSLNGQIGPAHQAVSDVPSMLNNSLLKFAEKGLPLSGLQNNWIVDPWGSAYVYDDKPKSESNVLLFGYKLYSPGPDKASGTKDDIVAQ